MNDLHPKIALQAIDGLLFVASNEILSATADGNYTLVNLTMNRTSKVLRRLEEVAQLVPTDTFCRIHRSHLINMEHVIRMDSEIDAVLMSNGASLPLARDRKADFIEKFTRI